MPQRNILDVEGLIQVGLVSIWSYGALLILEAVLALCLIMRKHSRVAAGLLFCLFVFECLCSFQNHRVLLAVMLLVIALRPVPSDAHQTGFLKSRVYWNLDILRWQVSLVYICTALHKCNPDFLDGSSLENLFFQVHVTHDLAYPAFLRSLLSSPAVCKGLAMSAIAVELALPVLLWFRRSAGFGLLLMLGMHGTFAILMPNVALFSLQMLFVAVAFLPERLEQGAYRLRLSKSSRPRLPLCLLWPGLVKLESADDEALKRWQLVSPSGQSWQGFRAWRKLMLMTPLLLWLGEICHSWPFPRDPNPTCDTNSSE